MKQNQNISKAHFAFKQFIERGFITLLTAPKEAENLRKQVSSVIKFKIEKQNNGNRHQKFTESEFLY